jgi:hypothetical protein
MKVPKAFFCILKADIVWGLQKQGESVIGAAREDIVAGKDIMILAMVVMGHLVVMVFMLVL